MASNTVYTQLIRYVCAFLLLVLLIVTLHSCNKLIEIDPPSDSITSKTTFGDSASATGALLGSYAAMSNANSLFSGGNLTIFLGLYADELAPTYIEEPSYSFYVSKIDPRIPFYNNLLWPPLYKFIYQVNVVIKEASVSETLKESVKNRIVAEAKFLRAYYYFYMVNMFGEVPLILTPDFKENSIKPRSSIDVIYKQIVEDLTSAIGDLPEDYIHSKGERVRANKYAAMALYARVLLYLKKYQEAEALCNEILSKESLYALSNDVREVFSRNGREAILQLFIEQEFPPFNVTGEGIKFIPVGGEPPTYQIPQEFVQSFEAGDLRRKLWIDSVEYEGVLYYYPRKLKLGSQDVKKGGDVPQYYTLLNVPEIYLIRAECRANTGKYFEACTDLNFLRQRAELNEVNLSDLESVMDLIVSERKIELMTQQGHRWLDLIRLGLADSVNRALKPNWDPLRKYLPIPFSELQANPMLVQTPGYN